MVVEAEQHIITTEETTSAYGKAIGFQLQREAELMERCEDLQNQTRRQNLRLYQVPEEGEGRNLMAFIKNDCQGYWRACHWKRRTSGLTRCTEFLCRNQKKEIPPLYRDQICRLHSYGTNSSTSLEAVHCKDGCEADSLWKGNALRSDVLWNNWSRKALKPKAWTQHGLRWW